MCNRDGLSDENIQIELSGNLKFTKKYCQNMNACFPSLGNVNIFLKIISRLIAVLVLVSYARHIHVMYIIT